MRKVYLPIARTAHATYVRVVLPDGRHGTVGHEAIYCDDGSKAEIVSGFYDEESEADTVAHVSAGMSRYKTVKPLGITGTPPIRSEASARAMDARHKAAFRNDFFTTDRRRTFAQRLADGFSMLSMG